MACGKSALTKGIDSMRPVVVNDGWERTISDIITIHDYEQDGETFKKRYLAFGEQILNGEIYPNHLKCVFADGYRYQGQPVIISEFVGIALDNEQEVNGLMDVERNFKVNSDRIREVNEMV